MEQIPEDLGPVGVWQIKQFPQRLREYLVNEAQRELITVSELLTRLIVAYREGTLEAPPPPKTAFANEVLDRSIERIAMLAEHAGSIPKEVSTLAFGLIKADLRGLKAGTNPVFKPRLEDHDEANPVFKPRLSHESAATPEQPTV
jgi:hypothetical protein